MMRERLRTMDPQKKKKAIMLSAVLVVLLALGATLAYLSATTDQKENAFSFAENIKGRLDEPNWDPDKGKDLVPGSEIPKDPIVTNVSNNDVDEWAGVRVTFTDGYDDVLSDTDAARLLRLLDIDWNYDMWSLEDATNNDETDSAELIWVYKESLAPGEASEPLFNRVIIRPAYDGPDDDPSWDWDEDYAWLSGMVMTHTDSCYTYPYEDDCTCDPKTWRHHTMCSIYGMDGADLVGDQDTALQDADGEDVFCDCMPVAIHDDPECMANIAELDCSDPTHTADDSIGGFKIFLRAAVVQAYVEGMMTWDDTDTAPNLITLFEANPYEAPVTTP